MPLYLGSTAVDDLYLGDAVYGEPNVVKVYLGEGQVWPLSLWDVSTAVYSQAFSVASQETSPRGLFLKPDGTRMYVAGSGSAAVNEYSLSTAWDISTASYSQAFSVASQETQPRGPFFKPDGTRMYVAGADNDAVNEYSLSTAWDVSTASYSQAFSVASQEIIPSGLFFKPDGTRLYVAGDAVNEYSLSTAWDVSTASYSQNFSIASQELSSSGLFFKPDGTKMYVVGAVSDAVNEYSLSTAWDISTASYSQAFSVASQETSPRGLFLKPDGTRMYVAGAISVSVHQYNLG